MTNSITDIIKDIVNSLGKDFSLNTYCDDWLIEILYKGKRMLIYGYIFPNNDAAAVKLCNDKSACSEFLYNYKIPCVEHYVIDAKVDKKTIKEICGEIGYPIILKDNNGTCGQNVFRVMSFSRVMHNAKILWRRNKTVSICKEEKVAEEFRLIFFDGELVLCYKKMIPFVIGDGVSSIVDLLKLKGIDVKKEDVKFNIDYSLKLAKGVRQNLTWKHNLCLGSSPFIIKDPDPLMVDLAQNAIFNAGIKFCSVDVFKLKNGQYKVLEINGGVMMKYLSQCKAVNGYHLAFDIYKKAITKYFNM
jgi:glutathione synthase/RimK-type ligase-like ATP-grasp enzyme